MEPPHTDVSLLRPLPSAGLHSRAFEGAAQHVEQAAPWAWFHVILPGLSGTLPWGGGAPRPCLLPSWKDPWALPLPPPPPW